MRKAGISTQPGPWVGADAAYKAHRSQRVRGARAVSPTPRSLSDLSTRRRREPCKNPNAAGHLVWAVQATYNLAELQLVGANDCARSAITLLRAERTPVYGHVVLTRSCLELAGRAWLLLEPAIGIRIRVARGMNERLFGLREQRRMPLDGDRLARSRERENALLEVGAGLGMETVRARGGDSLAEERLGQTEVLRRVFDLPEDRGLGEAVYGMFSAVAHGTSFGLSDSVSVDFPKIPDREHPGRHPHPNDRRGRPRRLVPDLRCQTPNHRVVEHRPRRPGRGPVGGRRHRVPDREPV
jgi:hypothetical protein